MKYLLIFSLKLAKDTKNPQIFINPFWEITEEEKGAN